MLANRIDETDLAILQVLLDNSIRPHKEIGELVHLTGQAVGARIRKMQDSGIIEGYTLLWNPEKIGLTVHAYSRIRAIADLKKLVIASSSASLLSKRLVEWQSHK